MSIQIEAYEALEDIVGRENVTKDPVVLDSYCFVWGNELITGGSKFSTRPLAAVLPKTTEEVQAIVRVCNRFGIKCRPFATGFETAALTSPEPMLCVDMQRMDQIIKIDRKNKYAIVEPYVSQTRLMMELIKVGLRCNLAGGGPSCSILASTAAHFGSGATNISCDFGGRNLLGIEWVQPDGELVRLGPMFDGAPVNADGPGPSLRGVVRGYGGANGGIGIFTRVAVKLYPWYGPPEQTFVGESPFYGMIPPKRFKDFIVGVPGGEELADLMHLLYEENICYAQERLGLLFLNIMQTGSNDDLLMLLDNVPPEMAHIVSHSMLISLDAYSDQEMEYKTKVLDTIMEKVKGIYHPIPEAAEPALYNTAISHQGTTRAGFRPCGSFVISPVAEDAIDCVCKMGPVAAGEIFNPAFESGNILSAFRELIWSVVYGNEGAGHVEMVTLFDPADIDSVKETQKIVDKADKKAPEWGYGINLLENALSYREAAIDGARPYAINFEKWMRKIKKAFDPNNVAQAAFYVEPEPKEKQ